MTSATVKKKYTGIKWRNTLIHFLYVRVLKPIFFLFDPEDMHDLMTHFGKFLGSFSLTRSITRVSFDFHDSILSHKVLGINFENPVGLSAGFDKNAELLDILPSVGFGFAEVGSITGFPCLGNPRPRLWRLGQSKSLVIYYGLKNNGCEEIYSRLKDKKVAFPFGISIAMTNRPENLDIQNAVADYVKAFKTLKTLGDYITVNVSCPNALGGQPFLEPKNLEKLLSALDKIERDKPVFVKLSPDKNISEIDKLLEVLKKHKVEGIICTNLTKQKNNPLVVEKNLPTVGGMSGKPLQVMSDDLLSYIYKKEGKRFILIGCGGVFTAEDAYKKIRLGASLIQLITGMIFEGPQVVGEINRGLVEFLHRDGFSNISEAIGADMK